jgi:hypothetical protein
MALLVTISGGMLLKNSCGWPYLLLLKEGCYGRIDEDGLTCNYKWRDVMEE